MANEFFLLVDFLSDGNLHMLYMLFLVCMNMLRYKVFQRKCQIDEKETRCKFGGLFQG